MGFDTKRIGAGPDAIAPDGSRVHVLCALKGGSMAVFVLEPAAISSAVTHRSVEEIWYVAAGRGRIWRRDGDGEAVTQLVPGVSLTIPLGTCFQFRCDGTGPLSIVAVTMPPWPGDDEAYPVTGPWKPSGVVPVLDSRAGRGNPSR